MLWKTEITHLIISKLCRQFCWFKARWLMDGLEISSSVQVSVGWVTVARAEIWCVFIHLSPSLLRGISVSLKRSRQYYLPQSHSALRQFVLWVEVGLFPWSGIRGRDKVRSQSEWRDVMSHVERLCNCTNYYSMCLLFLRFCWKIIFFFQVTCLHLNNNVSLRLSFPRKIPSIWERGIVE